MVSNPADSRNELSDRASTAPRLLDQFHDRIQRGLGAVDVDPHLGPGLRRKAVHVVIGRRVQQAVDLKAQPQVLVTVLFAGTQIAEQFGRIGGRIRAWRVHARGLAFEDHLDVSIMTELVQQYAVPVTGRRTGRVAVVVRIDLRLTVRCAEARPLAVVLQRRKHDGRSGLPDHLQHAADAVVNIQRTSRGREAGIAALQLHHQTLGRPALQSQTTVNVEVTDINRVEEHVHNVRVIPDALRGHRFAADFTAVDGIVFEIVVADQRTLIVDRRRGVTRPAGLRPRSRTRSAFNALTLAFSAGPSLLRIMLPTMTGCARGRRSWRFIEAQTVAVRWRLTTRPVQVVFKNTVRDACICLVNLQHIESGNEGFVDSPPPYVNSTLSKLTVDSGPTKMPLQLPGEDHPDHRHCSCQTFRCRQTGRPIGT